MTDTAIEYGRLGHSLEGFQPVGEAEPMAGRAWLAAQLEAATYFADWSVYPEPPEQLAGGRCVVVAPRSPYWTWTTFAELTSHLSVHVLVPRMHGPAMDTIEAALAAVFELLMAMPDADIGPGVSLGMLEDIGASAYVAATVEVDLIGGTLS